jgi:hypothetical protein
MSSIEMLSKKFTITENGNVEIIETVKKQLSKEELMMEKQRYLAQQQQVVRQSTSLKTQYDAMDAAMKEVDEMIAAIPETTL